MNDLALSFLFQRNGRDSLNYFDTFVHSGDKGPCPLEQFRISGQLGKGYSPHWAGLTDFDIFTN